MGSEENEDKIRKVLHENPDGLSFNKLKKATDMSTQSFINAKDNLIEKEELSSWKDGFKTMFSLTFCEYCHDDFENSVIKLFNPENSWQNQKTKIQRSISFVHFMHQISSNFLSLLIMYVFEDHKSVYRVCLKRLEEKLDEQRKMLQKSFSQKELEKMFEEMLTIKEYDDQRSSIIRSNAQERKQRRTIDEITRDLANYLFMPGPGFKGRTLKVKRTETIKDPKARQKYLFLENKYYDLKRQMLDTGYELDQLS